MTIAIPLLVTTLSVVAFCLGKAYDARRSYGYWDVACVTGITLPIGVISTAVTWIAYLHHS